MFICRMVKDKQQELIKRMIENGEILLLKEVFDYYPITPVIDYLKTNHKTLYQYIHNVDTIRAGTVFKIGEYFGVDEKAIMGLVCNQYAAGKKKRKK